MMFHCCPHPLYCILDVRTVWVVEWGSLQPYSGRDWPSGYPPACRRPSKACLLFLGVRTIQRQTDAALLPLKSKTTNENITFGLSQTSNTSNESGGIVTFTYLPSQRWLVLRIVRPVTEGCRFCNNKIRFPSVY